MYEITRISSKEYKRDMGEDWLASHWRSQKTFSNVFNYDRGEGGGGAVHK